MPKLRLDRTPHAPGDCMPRQWVRITTLQGNTQPEGCPAPLLESPRQTTLAMNIFLSLSMKASGLSLSTGLTRRILLMKRFIIIIFFFIVFEIVMSVFPFPALVNCGKWSCWLSVQRFQDLSFLLYGRLWNRSFGRTAFLVTETYHGFPH